MKSYISMSDSQLVELAKQGDQMAYRAIYEKYSAPVRASVGKYFSWSADVDDVVLESFQKMFTKIDKFDSSRDLLPWLFTIASNTALDHLSRLRREEEKKNMISDAECGPESLGPVTEDNPEDEIISGEDHERLLGFIEELPAKYKGIIQDYMIEEMEYEEIAKRHELPLNTVRTRIRRGKEQLAQMMTRGEVE